MYKLAPSSTFRGRSINAYKAYICWKVLRATVKETLCRCRNVRSLPLMLIHVQRKSICAHFSGSWENTHETVGIVGVERDLHTGGAASEFHIAKFFCSLLCPLNVHFIWINCSAIYRASAKNFRTMWHVKNQVWFKISVLSNLDF